jgi:uncharacterized membrane protein YkoI
MAGEVKSALEATKIAQSYIGKYRWFSRPLKAVREDDTWFVDLDVGAFNTIVAKVKIDAKSGEILEYNMSE